MADKIPDWQFAPSEVPWARWAQNKIVELSLQLERVIENQTNTNKGQNGTLTTLGNNIVALDEKVAEAFAVLTVSPSQINPGALPSGVSVDGNEVSGGTVASDIHAPSDITSDGTLHITGASYFPQAYANPVTTGTYYAAYLNGGDYRLGRTASSQRYKQDISTMPVPVQAFMAMRVVQFRWKAEVEAGRDQGFDFGVIAEELDALGLTPWVFYNEAGVPEGVHYERLFLTALPLIQDQQRRIDAIEMRLAELEH